jgi:hypothetical protein
MRKLIIGAVLLAGIVGANAEKMPWEKNWQPRTAEEAIDWCVADVRLQHVLGAPEFDVIKGPGGHISTYGNDQTRFLFRKCLSQYGAVHPVRRSGRAAIS